MASCYYFAASGQADVNIIEEYRTGIRSICDSASTRCVNTPGAVDCPCLGTPPKGTLAGDDFEDRLSGHGPAPLAAAAPKRWRRTGCELQPTIEQSGRL